MSWLMKVRIAVAVMGVVIWAYAVKVDDPRVRLVGIVLLAIALALRFLGRRPSADRTSTS